MSFFKKLKTDIGVEGKNSSQSPTKNEKIEIEKIEKTQKENKEKKEIKKEEPTKKETQDWLKSQEGQLAVDVYQTPTEFCIQAPIAGVAPEDLDITIENDMLIIKGERKEPDAGKEKSYFYQECYWGPFSRQIILPEDIDPNRIKASLQKGILMIRIPRATKIKKKKIEVIASD